MKVGNHAGETFEQILERKNGEFAKAGKIFWGYGGTACHPIQQVQPFARLTVKEEGSIYLVMQYVDSKADPDIVPATEYSADGINWQPIPDGIVVTGSRYALVLDEITPGQLNLPPRDYLVGIGPSRGKPADTYLQGRVDKGCLTRGRVGNSDVPQLSKPKKISYVARLQEPYAVILRGS